MKQTVFESNANECYKRNYKTNLHLVKSIQDSQLEIEHMQNYVRGSRMTDLRL